MKGFLVLLCLVGVTYAAPQKWPRRDGALTPRVRYVHPPKSNYRYLPQLEDDDEVAVGRQELLVGTVPPSAVPPVTVTPDAGSVAPPVVVQPTKVSPVVPGAPPGSSPVAPPQNIGSVPQRPPFQPRPPPKDEEEEEEDEDDDESEEADDENEEDDDENEDEDDDNDDDDEERKRQEVTSEKKDVASPAVVSKPPAPPVATVPAQVEPSSGSVEDVNAIPSVESNEVETPVGGGSGESLEQLEDGIEALVPGYITDQGEVLVPVDTVTGDQHISIVPDPYTRQRHGSTFNDYRSHPFYYQDAGQDYFGF